MAVSRKNEMLTFIQRCNSCNSLAVDFIRVMSKIAGMSLLATKLPDGLDRSPQSVDGGQNGFRLDGMRGPVLSLKVRPLLSNKAAKQGQPAEIRLCVA